MKTFSLEVPEQIAVAVEDYVKAGFCSSGNEVFVAAMADFLRRNQVDLLERFAREDIEWAKKESRKSS